MFLLLLLRFLLFPSLYGLPSFFLSIFESLSLSFTWISHTINAKLQNSQDSNMQLIRLYSSYYSNITITKLYNFIGLVIAMSPAHIYTCYTYNCQFFIYVRFCACVALVCSTVSNVTSYEWCALFISFLSFQSRVSCTISCVVVMVLWYIYTT